MDICDFPLSDDRSWKFWAATAQWSKHPQVINWSLSLYSPVVLVCELFVLEGLMHYTPQSVKIWKQPLVSQPPAAFMGVSKAQEGAKK